MTTRVIVYSSDYPTPKNGLGDVFVHERAKAYRRHFDIEVIGVDRRLTETLRYEYEGIHVTKFSSRRVAVEHIKRSRPSVLLIHFFEWWMYSVVVKALGIPTIVWVHGVEALGWYRRLFNLSISVSFAKYIIANCRQMLVFNRLIKYSNRTNNRVTFVFVSKWMRRIAQRDAFAHAQYSHEIPNPIDTRKFAYRERPDSTRLNVLLVRSFESRKYATDIAMEFITRVSRMPYFAALRFTVVGGGRFFAKDTGAVRHLPNVAITNGFLTHAELVLLHESHGVFLCPTRQDAQGVSMCEAMSSGLVPLTSRSTAIPEFVRDGIDGFLCDNVDEMVEMYNNLVLSPTRFTQMSRAAHEGVFNTCSMEQVLPRELEVIERSIQ